ncbi:hypothetical protein ACTJIJ_19365 [Niabella sp. 22666]|uniref:hypothetical protein n=1 Tax=Niabella sp. 22666 TaxID=3453954 RepID=UPI003F8789D9
MQKVLSILFFHFALAITISAQSVVINTDGTHSPVVQTGNTVIAVNADGTHSVGIVTGNIITVVDPQGRHSVGFIPYNINSNTVSNNTSSYWDKNPLGSSLNYRSRHGEAAPNRFYSLGGEENAQLWKPRDFQYSFVSQTVLEQIISGSKIPLVGLKTEDHKKLGLINY